MTAGIYRFINNRTGEVYVGQSTNIWIRRANHHKELTLGTHHNRGLQEDHNRGDTFTFEVLEKMPNATRKELEEREIFYINKFNSFYEGYNQTPGGEYDKYKGQYEYGGDRLPFHKYKPVVKSKPQILGICPECSGNLVKRKGKYGEFVGCSNYPKCRYWISLEYFNRTKTKSRIPKVNYNSTIEWQTCKYCGHEINKVAKKCPYCNEPTPTARSKPIKQRKTDFEKFITKKRNYLTKADCEFLAEKYEIDISDITVKKANTVICNKLNKSNQWDLAMEQLYTHNTGICINSQKPTIEVKKSTGTNGTINIGTEPLTSDKVKDEFNYPAYWSYGIDKTIDKNINNMNSDKNIINDSTTKKANGELSDLTKSNDFNYCSNCGCAIESTERYCANCGEKINRAIESKSNIKKQEDNSLQSTSGGDIFATIVLVLIIIGFVFSIIILNSDIEGPITTIAAIIFVSVLCFCCYTNLEQ